MLMSGGIEYTNGSAPCFAVPDYLAYEYSPGATSRASLTLGNLVALVARVELSLSSEHPSLLRQGLTEGKERR